MIEFYRVQSTTLGTRTRTLLVQVRGVGSEGADASAEQVDSVEVLQPVGLFVRPASGTEPEAVCVRLGEQVVALCLTDKTLSTFADVDPGETRLYSAGNAACRIRLNAAGGMEIESAPGVSIQLNGGVLKVARDTDSVDRTTAMGTFVSEVTVAVNGLAPGSVTPFPAGAIGEINVVPAVRVLA